ncbi:flavin monoamine oxidase family protein [Taklimakanibacter lacteus]|uniref:flavin monoamine oxidase family protein n=1 Tax=Taklimakanibacter lacteus TaxID=2268456 RepID=UPI000E6696D7
MMIQYPLNPDVVIIGAGAAGIGAGRALAKAKIPFIIIEAKDRIGGRAFTDTTSLGHLWDHGCHWFHSADKNVLRNLAEEVGHKYRSEPRTGVMRAFMDGQWKNDRLREDFVWGVLGDVAEAGRDGRDIPAAALLDQNHPWYPMAKHWLALMYSVEPEEISTRDAGNYDDTGLNLPVEDGYGALIARLAAGLPIRTSIAATRISARGKEVLVETNHGTITAKAAIVATPARMLETGRLGIDGLPSEIAQAFADAPMGYYEKIAVAFDGKVFDGFDVPYADIFDPVAATTHPLNFELHPFGRPIAVTHIAGNFARDMEREGEAGMIDFAVSALVRAFGSDLRKRIKKATTTHWSSDIFINGAYSCARPGKGAARKAFAAPIQERIFLAGEHVHPTFQATAHGAFETGLFAAEKAIMALGHMTTGAKRTLPA